MIYDISVQISEKMIVYPGDPAVEIIPDSRISKGESSNLSTLKFGSHTGTHVDPPYHMKDDGLTVDRLPLDALIGECFVCDVGDAPVVRIEELVAAGIPLGIERVLLKTRNSAFWNKPEFRADFTHLDPDAARWLIDHGVRLVGIDYLSVDPLHSEAHPTHMRLIESGVIIAEGLDLSAVSQGIYTLVCLPLKVLRGDGGPARAILISDSVA